MTIGIKPTWAAHGIRVHPGRRRAFHQIGDEVLEGAALCGETGPEEGRVEFLASGDYRWNAGMFVWSFRTRLRMLFSSINQTLVGRLPADSEGGGHEVV